MAESKLPDREGLGAWLAGRGPDVDLAICTRVRFARNVDGFRFSTCMDDGEAEEIAGLVRGELQDKAIGEDLRVLDLGVLEEIDREVLVERHLISRDHAHGTRARSVAVNEEESVAVMVNEEDHVRAQVFASGFSLEGAYARAERLDEALLQRLPYAFSESFGFLTACPTNVGTGLRLSVMLHLPGLSWADEMEKVNTSTQKIHLAVRGLYGEGSRGLGDFWQVSNQVTLGRSEQQLLEDVQSAVTQILQWERKVREALLRGDSRQRTLDRVHRADGLLRHARILSSEEALTGLSALRFGVQQGILPELDIETLNRALLLTQPAHLQRTVGAKMTPQERDARRAELTRTLLVADKQPPGAD